MAKKSDKKGRKITSGGTKADATPLIPRAAKPQPATIAHVDPQIFSWRTTAQALVIAALVLWIYSGVLHGTWLWDDDYLISENPVVHDPNGILDIWFNPASLIDYFPLTVTVEWLEWQIWPNEPFCYHLTSVLLHIAGSLLTWRLFQKLGLRLAWLGGLLFAIHPVMVESVAWMAEIKNTLATPPFLLGAICWIDYDRTRKIDDYFMSIGWFLIAMLCKTTMVMFPFLILFYAWWKHERVTWRDLRNSIPFFVISLAVGTALINFLHHGVGEELTPLGGVLSRVACAALSFSFYFSKSVLPIELFPIYPQWTINPPTWDQFLPYPVFGIALYWLWKRRHTWGRHILFGFGFFILNLLPFVGFRMISFMRLTWVMDHFLYLPIIGLIGVAVAGISQFDRRFSAATRPFRVGALALVLTLLAFESHDYALIFRNQTELWTYTIHHNSRSWPAYNNLGNVLSDQNRFVEAKASYESALQLNPFYPEAHNNLGRILAAENKWPEALAHYDEALRLCPELGSAQQNRAILLQRMNAQARKP